MAKSNIDLSKFKHVSSDKNSTKLRHSDGHELTIAHKGLGKDFQKQLSALSGIGKQYQTADQANQAQDAGRYKHYYEGGAAENKSPIPTTPQPDNTERAREMYRGVEKGNDTSLEGMKQNLKRGVNEILPQSMQLKAQGGEVRKMYANPEEAVSKDDNAPVDHPMSIPHTEEGLSEHIGRLAGKYGTKVLQEAIAPILGFGGAAIQGAKAVGNEAGKMASGIGKGVDEALPDTADHPVSNPSEMQQAQAQAPIQSQPQQPQAESQVSVMPEAQAPQPQSNDPYGTQSYMGAMQKGLGQLQESAKAGQAAAVSAGTDRAVADIAYNQEMNQTQAKIDSDQQENTKLIQNVLKDIDNNHINPKHYQESLSTGQKIATAIGMLAGGMGSGLTHTPNMAAAFFDKQIDRDIAAQEKAQGDRVNLLHAYEQKYQNRNQAALMAKATLQAKYATDIAKASNSAINEQAKSDMLAKSGELQMKSAELVRQATMMKFMTQTQGGAQAANKPYDENAFRQSQAYLMLSNPELAKERAQAHVPGVGDAPAGTVIPNEVKQQIVAHKTVNDLMNRSLQFSQQPMPTHPVELLKYRAQAKTIQQQLIASIKQAQHDGVYKPSEAEFLLGQIGGSPGSVFADVSSVPKIREIQDRQQQEYNNLLTTYGFPAQQLPHQPEKAAPQVQQQPQYKTVNGIKYMRGPDGKAIPVK